MLRADEQVILLDTGPGTLQKLLKLGITYEDVDRVFYTHYHPDHFAEFIPMLFAMRHAYPRRQKALWLFGPPGLRELYDGLNNLLKGSLSPKTYDVRIVELWDAEVSFGSWYVVVRPLVHLVPSVGYRVVLPSSKAVTYSGDTDYCEAMVDLARDVEVLILECAFPEEMKVEGHLVPSLCGKIAQQASPKQLVLTHFYPQWNDRDINSEFREFYPGEFLVAEDMTRITL